MLEARRTRRVLIALLIVAIALITIDFRDGETSSAHSFGGRLFGPVEHLSGDVTGWFRGGGNSAEISALQQQNDQLRAQLAQAQVSSKDVAELGARARPDRLPRRQDRPRLGDRRRRRLLGHGDDRRRQRQRHHRQRDRAQRRRPRRHGHRRDLEHRDRAARHRRGHHGRHPDGGRRPDRRAHRHRRLVSAAAPRSSSPCSTPARRSSPARNWSRSARWAAAPTSLASRSAPCPP